MDNATYKFKDTEEDFQCPETEEWIRTIDCEDAAHGKGCSNKSYCEAYLGHKNKRRDSGVQ